LEFVLDSFEVIADLEAAASIIRTLVQIDMGENVGRDLEGLRGWREVSKLATGTADRGGMGRIYEARQHAPARCERGGECGVVGKPEVVAEPDEHGGGHESVM
jgi:hypothetical protein